MFGQFVWSGFDPMCKQHQPTAEDNGYESFNMKINKLNHWKALNTCSGLLHIRKMTNKSL